MSRYHAETPCQRIRALVSSAPERAAELPGELARHAEGCAACRVEVTAARRLAGLLGEVGADYAPRRSARELVDAALAGPDRAPAGQGAGWRLAWPLAGALAAAATVAVVVWPAPAPVEDDGWRPASDFVTQSDGAPAGPRPAVPGRDAVQQGLAATSCKIVDLLHGGEPRACEMKGRLETGATERATVVLDDGTTLEVNRQTLVEIAAGHPRGLRVERGEVLLDVVKQQPLPPLEVALPTGHVQVIGTRLAITAHASLAVVDVVRGQVVATAGGERADVGAGDEALLYAGQGPVVQAAGDLGEATAWAEAERIQATTDSGLGVLRAKAPGDQEDTEQALRLVRHDVRVTIQGQVARTVVEEEFANDRDVVLEGIYTFPMPPGARIAGLDLEVDGHWEEGAIVERERGDKIWAGVIRNAAPEAKRREIVEFVWVPGPWKDPALLNWKQGNTFELRIFPIPKRGARRVRITYTETLPPIPGGRRYTYPLPADPKGGAQAERFRFEARVGGASEARVGPYVMDVRGDGEALWVRDERSGFVPIGDLVIDVPDPHAGRELRSYAFGDGGGAGFGLLALRPDLPERRGSEPVDLVAVVDRSYSIQEARLARAAEVVERVVGALPAGSRVQVLACAAQCETLVEVGTELVNSATPSMLRRSIEGLEPLGSTRVAHAFERAGEVLGGLRAGRAGRVLYLGDGVPSVGELEPARLGAVAARAAAEARIVTVSLGGEVDAAVLRAIAGAEGAYVAHGGSDTVAATAWRALARLVGRPLEGAALELPAGAFEVVPAALGAVWPGEERLVAFRLDGRAAGEAVLRGTLDGAPFERRYPLDLEPRPVAGNAFLPRLWAERRIDALQGQDAEANREEIVRLSKAHHVVSRHTSLLVLESPAMARAFRVAPTRPATDWTGEEESEGEAADAVSGTEVAGKTSLDGEARGSFGDAGLGKAAAPADLDAVADKGGRSGSGGLGVGSKGNKSLALKERPVRLPSVSSVGSSVSGGLDTNAVRAVLRRNQAQLRAVYERQLRSDPTLAGRYRVDMTIGPNGQVVAVDVRGGQEPLAGAIAGVVKRWRFPAPQDGGTVRISYPILFQSADGGAPVGPPPSPGNDLRSLGNGPGRWVAMRKVWFREGSVERAAGPRRADRDAVAEAEAQRGQRPDSRERTRDLFRAYLRAGELARAGALAAEWLARDRMDAGALVALSALASLQGDVERARDLLASAVDVEPASVEAHERMVVAYRGEGDEALRCAHVLSLALLQAGDRAAQVEVLRCGGEAERHLGGLDKGERRRAERELKQDPRGPRKSDRLTLDATWEGQGDLDLVVLTPRGRVLSWQGGAKRVAAHDARGAGHERLALSVEELGRYRIFVVPRAGQALPARGKLRVSAYGASRTLPFETVGGAVEVADAQVSARWRHERL